MKLYKKNKGLLISVCAISIVALATVGFSTWILGINDPSKDIDNINVEIDTHKDRTCALEVKTTEDKPILKLSENIGKSIDNDANTGFGYQFDEKNPAKFDIKLDYFNFAFPKTNATFDSVAFTTTFTKDGVTGDPNISAKNLFGRPSGTEYKYIEFVTEDITSTNLDSKATLTNVGSYNYYSLNEKILKFKWGNYYTDSYNGKTSNSPASYYQLQLDRINDTYKDTEKLEKQLDVLSKAKTEFEALDNALKGATINLNITLSVTFTD
ncbi:MAG: hypothetical protein MR606_00405 [Mollicutes bacterium]|nr:hypothetical protein [Mollicutes bacterium]MDD7263744.1 hypothetical protein [bacterium]MDY4979800.1 hypothetical protein [Candidatus Onthovivens sp.]